MFDAIRIDCLNGDKYRTGKIAPDGSPDPSIFSTVGDPVGIQVGTAIATLVRKADHASTGEVGFRHLWGQAKREELIETAEVEPGKIYESIEPVLPLGLPFAQTAVSEDWFDWPTLPDLFPVSFPGVKTSRNGFLIDIDLDPLKARIADYFNAELRHEEITRRHPAIMKDQVLKKWLSYRESDVLGRALTPEEVLYFAETTRRIGGLLVTNGVHYLVTWNFRHIANAAMRSQIERVCRQSGYEPPIICTPNELMESNHEDATA